MLQHSLNDQVSWTDVDTEEIYLRTSLFWNILIWDRLISLSCGQPYTIKELDIRVDTPTESYSRVSLTMSDILGRCVPNQAIQVVLPESYDRNYSDVSSHRYYVGLYLNYMGLWARFIGNTGLEHSISEDSRDEIESQISRFLDDDLAGMIIPYANQSDPPLKVFMVQKKIDFLLWGFRPEITSLRYDDSKATNFSYLALQTVENMRKFMQETRRSFSFRHHMVSSLAGALLAFCSLIVREAISPGYQAQNGNNYHAEGFQSTLSMLRELADSLPYARRVLLDFDALVEMANGIVCHGVMVPAHIFSLFPYRTPDLLVRPTPDSHVASACHPPVLDQGCESNLSDIGSAVLWL